MLFFVKKYVWLDLLVTAFLAGSGACGIWYFEVPFKLEVNAFAILQGMVASLVVAGWTLLVQAGYALIKGRSYARKLTESLAIHYSNASIVQALAGGMTAACGEEIFFRGFVQGKWGLPSGAFMFGLAHFGEKDIRIVSYWAFVHGALFGLAYQLSGNLLIPMLAHGLFDLGGVLYFRRIMRTSIA